MNSFLWGMLFVLAFMSIPLCSWNKRYRGGSVQQCSHHELENISDTLIEIKAELVAIRKELSQTKKDQNEKVIVNRPIK